MIINFATAGPSNQFVATRTATKIYAKNILIHCKAPVYEKRYLGRIIPQKAHHNIN